MTEDRFVELLQQAVEKVKTEEDPVELNQYRKLFKKNVPLTLRMYVAAYLAKNAAGGRDNFRNKRDRNENRRNREPRELRENREEKNVHVERESFEKREGFDKREGRQDREPAPRVVIPEEQAATIFISIGRNRRVFPRDLIGLIVTHANIDRSRIGDIRVLDNYSFVQLYSEDCASVIDSLNGTSFRGRKLNVSYSRKKDEETDTAVDAIDTADSTLTVDAPAVEDDGQTAFFPPEDENKKSVYDEIQPETNGSNYLI